MFFCCVSMYLIICCHISFSTSGYWYFQLVSIRKEKQKYYILVKLKTLNRKTLFPSQFADNHTETFESKKVFPFTLRWIIIWCEWQMLEPVSNVRIGKQSTASATREVKKLQSCNKVLTCSMLVNAFTFKIHSSIAFHVAQILISILSRLSYGPNQVIV